MRQKGSIEIFLPRYVTHQKFNFIVRQDKGDKEERKKYFITNKIC